MKNSKTPYRSKGMQIIFLIITVMILLSMILSVVVSITPPVRIDPTPTSVMLILPG